MIKSKKKHHYLPQCYIKGFTDSFDKVWVYNKEMKIFSEQGENGTFHIRYFYRVDFSKYKKISIEQTKKIRLLFNIDETTISPIEEYPDMVEDLLSDTENQAALIIKKLVIGEKISKIERMNLSTFLAFMHTRTPIFRSRIEEFHKKDTNNTLRNIFANKESLENLLIKMQDDGYEKFIDTDSVIKFYQEERYKIVIPREMSVRDMLLVSSYIDDIFYNKTWIILRTSTSFITSDSPTFLVHSNSKLSKDINMRIDDPDAKIFFPLSKELLLVMESTSAGPVIFEEKIDKVHTRKMNELIASHSGNYIIARDEALCRKMV